MAETGRSRTLLWIVIGGGVFFLFVLAVFTLVYLTLRAGGERASLDGFGDKIGVIDLEGVILDSSVIVPQIKKFGDDDSIKAIILRVNSPGGGVAASEEIYRAVKRIRDDKKKRIVASISTVGASGAYYVSSATNKIYADNGSVVGSIGVIAEWVNYGDLMKWAKLKPEVLKVGALKDTGDPSREMTPEERAYMQSLIDNMYGQFVQAVAEGRHAKADDIKAIADGRVWTGQEALAHAPDRSNRRLPECGRRYRQVRRNQRRTRAGAPGQRSQDIGRSVVWGHFAVPADAREADGSAGGILLLVEVRRSGFRLSASGTGIGFPSRQFRIVMSNPEA